ncbi:MAG: hypothetical protein KDD38_00560 [Bdellovibrionales bacterium]|nr:hypothetical protein [Bdellovibrionales bacterium]
MKSLKLVTLALIATVSTSSTSFANDLQDKKSMTVQLQIQKQKLLEEIAVNTLLAEKLATDVEFIEDYSTGDLTLSTIIAQYPVATQGTFIAAVTASAKFFNSKVIDPALLKQEAGVIVKLLQRFPKLSKNTAWAAGIVATAASIYYTVDRAVAYADLKSKTAEQVGALYAAKVAELNMRRDAVAVAVSELLDLNRELNQMSVSKISDILGKVPKGKDKL